MAKKPRTASHGTDKAAVSYDPALASLFESSLGPIRPTSQSFTRATTKSIPPTSPEGNKLSEGSISPVRDAQINGNGNGRDQEQDAGVPLDPVSVTSDKAHRSRKRKHKDAHDDLEGRYMQNLARDEAREEVKRQKSGHGSAVEPDPANVSIDNGNSKDEPESDGVVSADEQDIFPSDIPQHETLQASEAKSDVEKASRTVFLANVSTTAIKSKSAKRTLLEHLASFLPSLPKGSSENKVESFRFRSTAFMSSAVPKKAAFAKKDLMDSTTKSTNAYAVYTTQLAAREAVKRLNGTMVLDRHLRVDSVAHPAKQDHRRCVFVGNLGFVDDESAINDAEDKVNDKRPRKAKEAADVEEGLWRQFGKVGTVESVRVVRDKTTRVGKGFAYVQFMDPNGVEKALSYNEKKFPPLLPRILRVTRAKNASKTNSRLKDKPQANRDIGRSQTPSGYRPKAGSQTQSLTGRASKLLGRAGAAQLGLNKDKGVKDLGVTKSPAKFVFEGYRASNQGKSTLKLGKGSKKKGKPLNRSSRRGAAFKASGQKKGSS